jgi:type 1 fimbria pilin
MNTYKKIISLSGSMLITVSGLTNATDRGTIQFYGMITAPTCQVNAAVTTSTPTTLSCLTSAESKQGMVTISEKSLSKTSPYKIVTVTYR